MPAESFNISPWRKVPIEPNPPLEPLSGLAPYEPSELDRLVSLRYNPLNDKNLNRIQKAAILTAPAFPISAVLSGLGDYQYYKDHPEAATPMNLGLSALGALPFTPPVVGALKGVKRAPALWHGAKNKFDAPRLMKEGFVRGRSAEIGRAGSSMSKDPIVSLRDFADLQDPKGTMFRVNPEVPPSEWHNLDPASYLLRESPAKAKAISKPMIPHREDEVFFPREKGGRSAATTRPVTDTEWGQIRQQEHAIIKAYHNLNDAVILQTDPRRVINSIQATKGNAGYYHRLTDEFIKEVTFSAGKSMIKSIARTPQELEAGIQLRFRAEKITDEARNLRLDASELLEMQKYGYASKQPLTFAERRKAFNKAHSMYKHARHKFMDDFEKWANRQKPEAALREATPEDLLE